MPTTVVAGIVLAMALVLMLTTGGLAYATRGRFELAASRRRRRLAHSFVPEVREAPPVAAPSHAEKEQPERREPNAKRTVRGPGGPRRRAKRAAAVRAVGSITAEVDALRGKLDVDAVLKNTESATQDMIERLRQRLNMYFASAKNAGTANDEVDSLKAKLGVHRAPSKSESIRHDEHERLKEKLGVQPASTESASEHELQTLKEKRAMQAAAPKGVSTTHKELETLKVKLAKQAEPTNAKRETADEAALKEKLSGAGAAPKRETTVRAPLETQLVDHGPRPTSGRNVDLHADTPSPKLDVSNRPAKDRSRASVAVDALDTTLREPRGERAAAATPVAPRPVSAATRRSAIADLVYEHRLDLVMIGLVLIVLPLLLLIIAGLYDM